MRAKLPIGILASGRGSNMSAILEQAESGWLAAETRIVISDVASAPALAMARQKGIDTLAVERANFSDKLSFEARIAEELQNKEIELLVLAGFMRLLSETFISRFPARIINVHPSLLPAFPGLNAQRQAIDYGVKISGCTVHFVNEIMDGGQIIFQASVPVLENDTENSLSARILKEEHRLLPEAIAWFADNFRKKTEMTN